MVDTEFLNLPGDNNTIPNIAPSVQSRGNLLLPW